MHSRTMRQSRGRNSLPDYTKMILTRFTGNQVALLDTRAWAFCESYSLYVAVSLLVRFSLNRHERDTGIA